MIWLPFDDVLHIKTRDSPLIGDYSNVKSIAITASLLSNLNIFVHQAVDLS